MVHDLYQETILPNIAFIGGGGETDGVELVHVRSPSQNTKSTATL